jgi:carbamoyl-phosphate synthase large subunit
MRGRRVLVMRAGSGASNNLIRSLRAGDPSIVTVGCHHDPFIVRASVAERTYLIPLWRERDAVKVLERIVARERIDVIVPTTDEDVRVLSGPRHPFRHLVFLPCRASVELCQDKFRLVRRLRSRGVNAPKTIAVTRLTDLRGIWKALGGTGYLWCRMRRGSGSLAAIPVGRLDHARGWIQYWVEMRGVSVEDFTLAEYLPGRDFAVQSLWKDGKLVLLKTSERISYFQGTSRPSGVSSIAALHKTVEEPTVAETAAAAVRAVARKPNGAFSVDLKEDRRSRPSVTEINPGRFLTGTTIFDLTGERNMAVSYVRLAVGERVDVRQPYDADAGYYLVRDLDARPVLVSANEIAGSTFGEPILNKPSQTA